jgi:hypothetical protein
MSDLSLGVSVRQIAGAARVVWTREFQYSSVLCDEPITHPNVQYKASLFWINSELKQFKVNNP